MSSKSDDVRLAVGHVEIDVPPGTPTEAVALIETLVGQIDQLTDRTAQLHIALDSRVAIEQAKGVLAERRGITIAEAFELLRSTARSRRMQLHALAETVVAAAGRPDASDDLS